MATSQVFWSLVKQDVKGRRTRNRRFPKAWRITYLVIIILAIIGYTTYSALQKNVDFSAIWLFSLGMPFVVFGISLSIVAREWRNNTAAWWLSLPYSRIKLMTAKWIASMLRGVLFDIAVFLVVALLSLYSMALQGDLTHPFLLPFFSQGIRWFLFVIAITPFVSSLGILFAIITRSKARPVIPLLWVLFILLWNVVYGHNSRWLTINSHQTTITLSSAHFLIMVASWVIAYVLIHVCSYLLDHQLAM